MVFAYTHKKKNTNVVIYGLKSIISLMFNLMDGPIDEHMCALFQYTPFAPFGLFVSTDFCIYVPLFLFSSTRDKQRY